MTDAVEDAAAAGLGGSLGVGRQRALIIVDPARAYIDLDCPLYAGVEAAVEKMKALRVAADEAGVPVIVTRLDLDPSGRQGGVFHRKVPALRWFATDLPSGQYIEGLAPRDRTEELPKRYPSAFAGTTLAATFTAMGVDALIIAGLTTSGCIRATATDAMQNGFIPIVVSDAVGDRLPQLHDANIFDIQAKIGEVVDSRAAIDLLERSACEQQ